MEIVLHPLHGQKLLTTKEAAAKLRCSYKTLEAWRAKGAGPRYITLPNGRIRYPEEWITEWIATGKN